MIAMDQNLKLYSDGNTMLEIAKKKHQTEVRLQTFLERKE